MKNIFILLLLVSLSAPITAQIKETHIPISNTLVGIWKQTGITNPNTGKLTEVQTGNYKVMNPDGTYYTFITWGTGNPTNDTTIAQYGNYEITSENLIAEEIVGHTMDPRLNGKNSTIKFELVDSNTLLMSWSPNDIDWIDEKWTRLPLSL
ncbi:DUF4488 domain-containing protein [Arenibacter latericius]|uniref:DUF4488 domain-containing protein n=1 Tax=Arenibacter latericius TaxID=86104 RepID=UPI00041B8049|nr:DUF4488 domain-containing protein [Arenibacter latericius]